MLLLEFEVLAMDYSDAPQVLRDFLIYHETICGHSKATSTSIISTCGCFCDFEARPRARAAHGGIGRDLHCGCGSFLPACRNAHGGLHFSGLSVARPRQAAECARAGIRLERQLACAQDRRDPQLLQIPDRESEAAGGKPGAGSRLPEDTKTLPHYLTLEESKRLLSVVDGKNKERDYCILCIFLNCGLRISELVGLNLQDDHGDSLRILGKGSKERVVYLNNACREALDRYLAVRSEIAPPRTTAMFLSNRRTRISCDSVQVMVKKT